MSVNETRKKNIRALLIYSVSTILLMLLIFAFSSQPAAQSEQSSGWVMRLIQNIFGTLMPEERLSFWVRKAAHIGIYFALGCSVRLWTGQIFLLGDGQNGTICRQALLEFVLAVLICFLYACSDEWHQTFVPGRSGELRDVGIDAIGFVSASAVVSLLLYWFRRRRKA